MKSAPSSPATPSNAGPQGSFRRPQKKRFPSSKDIYELGRNNLQTINQGTLYYPTGEFGTIIDTFGNTPFINEGVIEQPFIDNELTSALVVLGPTINEGTMNISEGFGSNHGVVNRGALNINQVWSSYITQEAGVTAFDFSGLGITHLGGYPIGHTFLVRGGEFRFGDVGFTFRSHLALTGSGVLSGPIDNPISIESGGSLQGFNGADPHPFPLLKVVTDGGTDHAAAEYEVVSSVDDLLTIQPQASFNLTGFRDVSASRAVLSDVGGVRRLEFRDALELTPPHTFFFRLFADDSPTP